MSAKFQIEQADPPKYGDRLPAGWFRIGMKMCPFVVARTLIMIFLLLCGSGCGAVGRDTAAVGKSVILVDGGRVVRVTAGRVSVTRCVSRGSHVVTVQMDGSDWNDADERQPIVRSEEDHRPDAPDGIQLGRSRTRDELAAQLAGMKWCLEYEKGRFDCSNMSSLLCDVLEERGFDADIVSDETHAWVLVRVDDGWAHVEATCSPPMVIPARRYDERYDTAEEAQADDPDDYGWNSVPRGRTYLADGDGGWKLR